jgi:hypothetical protein
MAKDNSNHLKLKPGDRVKSFIHPNGSVVVLPELAVTALRGMLKPRGPRTVTIEEMREAVLAAAESRF